MATTVRSGAVYGIGTYGIARYGVSSVNYTPDGVAAVASSDSGVIVIGDAQHVVVGVSMNAAVSSVGVVGVAVTSVVGVEATAQIGDNVSFKLDCEFPVTGIYATAQVGSLSVTADANVEATWPAAITASWNSIRFGWFRENTFVYFYINATAWNDWVEENVRIGDDLYVTVSGTRKYYGVVTDLPVISGISAQPQTLITVSNPEDHDGFIDQTAVFEIPREPMVSRVGSLSVLADANILTEGVEAVVYLGTPTQKTVNRIPVDGIEVSAYVGSVTLVGEANVALTGVEANAVVDDVTIVAKAVTPIVGVSTTASVGSVSYILDCVFDISGHGITSSVGSVVVSTTQFVYDANAYDRNRVVYVEKRTSSTERRVYVEEQNRMVLVERKPDVYDRYAYIDQQVRDAYVSSRTTSYERTARV